MAGHYVGRDTVYGAGERQGYGTYVLWVNSDAIRNEHAHYSYFTFYRP